MTGLKELSIGDALPPIELEPVSRLDLIKYAGASGDFNPIHTIDEEAKKAGLPGIIAHGMWTMGNLAKLFSPYYDSGFVKDYSVRFRHMVFLGDRLTLEATLSKIDGEDLTFDVVTTNQEGKTIIKGKLVFTCIE
ncbi:MaoC/PaaZ C-terminal domain-containing protein [Pullulanibacillus sp. KACC 23026]|uniref:MaoC/PaaZ C-terminal domain-containing protein n=1 Tax=Pullulanibacillus sp. KACC 23026 TaxID=3028315 RepID=UPI0023B0FF8D|nr:MaoC/PaaZ C-terminal domain-containing protein [Pullulanibacillus sp. KACC 23026]WEG10812.1 MaoC/PaaZ C-terminal domain-containing protein [Pullulanibacillus sp. KACC 23026]